MKKLEEQLLEARVNHWVRTQKLEYEQAVASTHAKRCRCRLCRRYYRLRRWHYRIRWAYEWLRHKLRFGEG